MLMSKNNDNDWFMPLSLEEETRRANRNEKASKKHAEENALRHCLKCNIVWETSYRRDSKKPFIYLDFPKYGIKKDLCYKCKEKK